MTEQYSPKPANDAISIAVVRSLDQFLELIAVRVLVYMGEQHCPYAEEIDGNDLAGATHLLAHVAGEPAGVLRMRWFSQFCKIERVTVRRVYRSTGVAEALLREAARIAARKGYHKLFSHVRVSLLHHWRAMLGVKERPGRRRFHFSGYEYVEVELDIVPAPNALDLDTDPLVLLRPEGRWDEPGVLDRSAATPLAHALHAAGCQHLGTQTP